MTWVAGGLIKGVGVRLLLCAKETLVWILIGSLTGTCRIDCCVFSPVTSLKWLVLCGSVDIVCVFVCSCCGPLQALMMFAEWKASCDTLHHLIKTPALQWHQSWNIPPHPLDFYVSLAWRAQRHQFLFFFLFVSDLKCHTNVNYMLIKHLKRSNVIRIQKWYI